MTLTTLLEQVEARHIALRLEVGGRIRCTAPKGALTADLAAAMKGCKAELQAHLADALLGVAPEPEPNSPHLPWAEELLARHGRVWLESPEDPLDHWRYCGMVDDPALLAAWRARCDSWLTWGALTAKGALICAFGGELPESFLTRFRLVPDAEVPQPEALTQVEEI